MAQTDAELTVAQRLGHLLDRGLLPAGGPAEAAERLIERLERPARIALLGLPGSGKSAILNLLIGSVLVPETLRLPTIIVQYGSEDRMVCTLADGKTQVVPGRDLNDVLTLNPALVTIEADLAALKIISLLEVSAGPMDTEQRRAAVWASKRADILIWCTTSYLPKEQQVWESMTDLVKDNGFLFLTKVDLLGGREAAQGMLERVEQRAGEEFRQVLSISAKQARAAMPTGGPVDRDLFRDSGAAAVITTIKTRVQMARRADTDMAELLLARHVEAGGMVARRFADQDGAVQEASPPEWSPPPEAPAEPEPRDALPEPVVLAPAQAEPEPEPAVEAQPEPEIESVAELAPVVQPEPEPEPEVQSAPEPEPQPASAPEPEMQPELPSGTGRRRFADRIKQIPMPADMAAQPAVPLRSTWKSKAETAPPPAETPRWQPAGGRKAAVPQPDSEPAAAPVPEDVPEVVPEPPVARAPLSEVLGSRPGAAERNAGSDGGDDDGPDDAAIKAMLAAVRAAPERGLDPTPRAERPMPTDNTPAAERSPRTQLFGARKAVAAAPAAAKPGERPARTYEPVTRVRAPIPRAPEPARPDVPTPEVLASPRFTAVRERPAEGANDSAPQRAERRERPRFAARAMPATPAAAAPTAAVAPVAATDHGALDAAIRLIVSRAAELARAVEPSAKVPVDMVLEHCRDTTEQVLEIVAGDPTADLGRIKIDLSQVMDLITLMLLEKGHAPADDALTLLLQIRRDLETLRSA